MQIDIERLRKEASRYKTLLEKQYDNNIIDGLSTPNWETNTDSEDTEEEVSIFLIICQILPNITKFC